MKGKAGILAALAAFSSLAFANEYSIEALLNEDYFGCQKRENSFQKAECDGGPIDGRLQVIFSDIYIEAFRARSSTSTCMDPVEKHLQFMSIYESMYKSHADFCDFEQQQYQSKVGGRANFETNVCYQAGRDAARRSLKTLTEDNRFQFLAESESCRRGGAGDAPESKKIPPGFNCKKARSSVEKEVCNSQTLSYYDNLLGSLYSRIRANVSSSEGLDRVIKSQISWLKQRDVTCSNLSGMPLQSCLLPIYARRIEHLAKLYRESRL